MTTYKFFIHCFFIKEQKLLKVFDIPSKIPFYIFDITDIYLHIRIFRLDKFNFFPQKTQTNKLKFMNQKRKKVLS